MNPATGRFEPLSNAVIPSEKHPLGAEAHAETPISVQEDHARRRGWVRFDEGEIVEVKGLKFRVHEIGEKRMVLKTLKQ